MTILLKNATIVNEGRRFVGCLSIDNEIIADIKEGKDAILPEGFDIVIDAEGCFLLPGIIDTHVHFREPGLTQKATFETESKAAAAGGVTTIFDMPNTVPQTTTLEAWQEKCALAKNNCMVNYAIFFGATSDNTDILAALDTGKIPGIKLFMGSSTGNMLVDDQRTLEKIFSSAKLPIVAHCEDTSIINENLKRLQELYGDDPDVKHHPEVRSEEACWKSTALAVELAKKHNAKLHVAHLTTAKELELFSEDHPNITAEVCAAHLLFSKENYATLGTRIKCNPSIKTSEDRAALRSALNSGCIHSIATDHAPHLMADKVGGCKKAASGMPMIQFSLVSMLELAEEGIMSMERLVELMAHNPAKLFQVKERGFLRVGYKADLALVRKQAWQLTPDMVISKCGWSPLEGRHFRWKVEKTFCNGKLIFSDNKVQPSPSGQQIEFYR